MSHQSTRDALPIIATVLFAVMGVFFDAFSYFHEVWIDDGTYSHGYFSLALAAFVLYSQRLVITMPSLYLNGKYIILLLFTLFIAYIAKEQELNYIYRSLFLVSIIFLIRMWYNRDESKVFIIPFLLIALAVPAWGVTIGILQYMAVIVVGTGVTLSGIEVLVQGFNITIPSGTFVVANGCSGLRYLLVGATMVVFYRFMYFKHNISAYKLLAFNIVLAILTNWVRIAYLVYVGHVSEMRDPLMADHNMLGWYIFIVPVVLTFMYGRVLERQEILIKNKQYAD